MQNNTDIQNRTTMVATFSSRNNIYRYVRMDTR